MAIDSYKLKNGQTRYRVTVYKNGERITQQRGFESKREAKNYEAYIRIHGAQSKGKTYDQVEHLYLESIEADLEGSTVNNVDNILKNNVPKDWRQRKISSIKVDEVQVAVNNIAQKCKTGPVYVRKIAAVFEFAESMDFIDKNPFKKIRMPKIQDCEPDSHWAIWTPEQFALFLETAKRSENMYAYPLFRTFLYTGMRHGEPIGIKWSDWDYSRRAINLHEAVGVSRQGSYIRKGTKKKSDREIIVDQETADAIESLRPFASGDYIFPISYMQVYRLFLKLEKQANLPHSRIHNMRVEHCTALLQNGAFLKDVQQRVGHKRAQTTLDTYARAHKDNSKVLDNLPKNLYTMHSTDA